MKTLILFLAAASMAFGQHVYTYEKETSLSGAAETVTVQLPTGSNKTVQLIGAEVYCSVACTPELLRDGTAATTTAGTVVPLNVHTTTPAAAATVFHTSNVGSGGGTHIRYYTVPAGTTVSIDLSDKGLTPGKNITLKTNSITGTARIYFQWREQ